LLGGAAYLLPLFFVVIALRWKRFVREGILAQKLLLSTSFLVLLAGIVHVFLDGSRGDLDTALLYTTGALRTSGGMFGGFVGEYMGYILYLPGTVLLAIPLLLVIGIYLIGMTPGGLWQRISLKCKQIAERRRQNENAKYSGKEDRRLRVNARRDDAKQEKQEKLAPPKEEGSEQRSGYTFREEEDEPMPRREKKRKQQDVVELVDIPDDDTDEVFDEVSVPNESTAKAASVDQRIEDILKELSLHEDAAQTSAETAEEKPVQEPATTTAESAASITDMQIETIKKLKALLDAGILTEEEFETKKKQILDL
jgi:hypothetical protein